MADERLSQLAQSCAQRGWRLARLMAGGAADADDIMQQAFMVALRKAASIPTDDAWPWFAKVIAHEARNFRRKYPRPGQTTGEPEMPSANPQQHAAQAELARLVGEALNALPQAEREAVSLVHVSGLTFRDAAQAADVPLSTLNTRLRSGLDKLRSRLRMAEGALLGCLPVAFVEPPPFGLEVATGTWLRAAHNAPTQPIMGAAGMFKLLAGAAAIGIALLLLFTVGKPLWQPSTRAPQDNTSLALADSTTAGIDMPKATPMPSNQPRETTPPANTDTPRDAGNEATAPAADTPEKPVVAPPLNDEVSIRGRCVEAYRDNRNKPVASTTPIAGAMVWLELRGPLWQSRENPPPHMPREMEELEQAVRGFDSAALVTTSAADGSWSFKGLPKGAAIVAHMAHPDYYCRYNSREAAAGGKMGSSGEARQGEVLMTFWADHAALSSLEAGVAPVESEFTLAAEPGVNVVGYVRAQNGNPIAGAVVNAGGGGDHMCLRTITGVDGSYRIGPFRAGSYTRMGVSAPKFTKVDNQEIKFKAAGRQSLDFELKPGGVVRGQFVPRPGRMNLDKLSARADHETGYSHKKRAAKLDERGNFIFDDLDADGKYRISVGESATRTLLASSDWVVATAEGVDLVLQEGSPAEVTVSVSAAAFSDTVKSYRLYIVPQRMCEASVNETLRNLFWENVEGKDIAAGESVRYQQRVALTIRLIAIPAGMAESVLDKPAFNVEQLKRVYISEAITTELGKFYTMTASQPLLAAELKLQVANREGGGVAVRRKSAWADVDYGPGAFFLEEDGTSFKTEGPFWPGEYEVYWVKDNWPKSHHAVVNLPGGAVTDYQLTVPDDK